MKLRADGVSILGLPKRARPRTPTTKAIGSMQSVYSITYYRRCDVMNEKLNQYLNGVFAPYDGVKSVDELKADLLSDLQERFRELKAEGKDDETAFQMTIDSIGDIEQTVREAAGLSRSLERQLLINFSASNLPKSDFAGVTAHKGKFEAS